MAWSYYFENEFNDAVLREKDTLSVIWWIRIIIITVDCEKLLSTEGILQNI